MTGVEMTHVPYRGSVPALTDVAAGHVQLMFCDDIVDRLHAEIKDFMVQPEIKDHSFKMGLLPIDTPSVASLRVFVRTEITRWRKVVEQAGIAGSQ